MYINQGSQKDSIDVEGEEKQGYFERSIHYSYL